MTIPAESEQVTNNSPDGAQMGRSATEKNAFFGATPVVQPASASQAVVAATIETLTENSTQSTPNTTIVAVGAGVTALDVTGSGSCPTEAATNTRMVLIDDNFADLADQQSKTRVDIDALVVLVNQLRSELVTLGLISGAA